MELPKAIEVLTARAADWAENLEEMFPRRVRATDTDIELLQLAGQDDYDQAVMVRDVWQALEIVTGLRESTIYGFFATQLKAAPQDETLRNLPTNSNCGFDCAKVISTFVGALAVSDPAAHDDIRKAAEHAISVLWRG